MADPVKVWLWAVGALFAVTMSLGGFWANSIASTSEQMAADVRSIRNDLSSLKSSAAVSIERWRQQERVNTRQDNRLDRVETLLAP